jgi:Ca2+-binding protein (EF-Hand superfamily)
MSSRKTAGRRATTKKRAQRATSNVFAMFDQAQIQNFKEAFNMIDQNRDGFIDKEDLHDMLASLGMYIYSVVSDLFYNYNIDIAVCCAADMNLENFSRGIVSISIFCTHLSTQYLLV